MNYKQKKRLMVIVSLIMILGVATGLTLYALKQNINLFYTPTQLLSAQVSSEQHIRLGGYVKKNSVHYEGANTDVNFAITDRVNEISVRYQGVLPNLFREGQAVVVTGTLQDQHILLASEVLAKHDEKYMPNSLKNNLKKGDGYGA